MFAQQQKLSHHINSLSSSTVVSVLVRLARGGTLRKFSYSSVFQNVSISKCFKMSLTFNPKAGMFQFPIVPSIKIQIFYKNSEQVETGKFLPLSHPSIFASKHKKVPIEWNRFDIFFSLSIYIQYIIHMRQ